MTSKLVAAKQMHLLQQRQCGNEAMNGFLNCIFIASFALFCFLPIAHLWLELAKEANGGYAGALLAFRMAFAIAASKESKHSYIDLVSLISNYCWLIAFGLPAGKLNAMRQHNQQNT